MEALANPEGLMRFESSRNYKHNEPYYASLKEFLAGRNADETEHTGLFLIGIVAKIATDFKDRTGKSVVPKIGPFNPYSAFNELIGRQNSYCF